MRNRLVIALLAFFALPAAADAPEGPRYAIGGTLAVHEGVRVEVPVEGIDGEVEWEAISAEGP